MQSFCEQKKLLKKKWGIVVESGGKFVILKPILEY